MRLGQRVVSASLQGSLYVTFQPNQTDAGETIPPQLPLEKDTWLVS